MASGGKRTGSGRKSGVAWNGNNLFPAPVRALARESVRKVLSSGHDDPLSVLVSIANDPDIDVQIRVQAATAATPFCYPRLSAAVVANVPAPSPKDTTALLDRLLNRFAKMAPPVLTIDAEPVPVEPSAQ